MIGKSDQIENKTRIRGNGVLYRFSVIKVNEMVPNISQNRHHLKRKLSLFHDYNFITYFEGQLTANKRNPGMN